MSTHYDAAYFAYQKKIGEIGGWANAPKFLSDVKATDRVIDFGCGGGFLLSGLDCRERIGVEINPVARTEAASRLDRVYASAVDLPEQCADLVISNNALEHCERPLDELRQLYKALVPGGRIIIVVPCEAVSHRYRPRDPNHHLYSWSPMAAGNLVTEAGFAVSSSHAYLHRWPPKAAVWAHLPAPLFHATCWGYGFFARRVSQVRVIGRKE